MNTKTLVDLDVVTPGDVPGGEQTFTCAWCGCVAWYRKADLQYVQHGADDPMPMPYVKCKQRECPKWIALDPECDPECLWA